MWDFDYTNTDSIKKILYENGLSMNKKFGQNFLISHTAVSKIADCALSGVDNLKIVYEIGPGLGCLTAEFLKRGVGVKGFEIDKGFADILKNRAFTDDDFSLVQGDAMDTLFLEKITPSLIVGNLPYNISAPLVAKIIRDMIASSLPNKMVFLLQKEVAYKFAASENSKEFSHLSFIINLSYTPKVAFNVTRGVFFPSPKVDSAVLVLDKKSDVVSDTALRQKCIDFSSLLFRNPRKTILNNLKNALPSNKDPSSILSSLGINPLLRPAELTCCQIISIFQSSFRL